MATSNGPDCTTGPNCCCDVCKHDRIFCDGDCCRCVPNILCAVFTPDTPSSTCFEVGTRLGTEENDAGMYSGSLRNIAGKGVDTEIEVTLVKLDDVCYWRVQIDDFEIDETFEIDHDTVTCRDPVFDIDVDTGTCAGTIHIERYDLLKVPFRSMDQEITEEAFTCGECDVVCSLLCVKYELEGESIREEFEWNSLTSRWEHGDDYITPTTNGDGDCEVAIHIEALGDVFDPVVIENCGIGTSETPGLIFSTTGGEVTGSCNVCTCWRYICGTCRCACDVLCVVRQSGFGIPVYSELAWDDENSRWGDDTFNIGLGRDGETGDCVLLVDGFDPVPTDSCGTGVNFSLEDDDGNRVIGHCKACTCFVLPAECCGTDLYQLPLFLVAEVEGVSGCACFTATVYLILDPTGTMWCGTGVGGCPDTRIKICVTCSAGSTCPIGLTVDVCCNRDHPTPGPIECGFASGFTEDSCTCPPLLLVLDEIVIDRSCCDNEPMAGGTIKITITE